MPQIKPTFDIIDGRVNRLTQGFESVEDQLNKQLKKFILSLDSKGGKFAVEKSSLKVLNRIKTDLSIIVRNSDYYKRINEFVDSFDDINANIQDIHQKVNELNIPKSFFSPEKSGFVKDTLITLQDAQVNSAFLEPVRRALFTRVALGASVGDTLESIEQLVVGTDERKGILTRWSGQVARDSLGQYQGHINAKILDEYEFKGFVYVGTLVEDSRSQCARWLGKEFIPKEELQKELNWAFRNGSGMVRTTTPETFAVYRGGYNCRHEAIPSNGPLGKENNIPKVETDQSKIDKDTRTLLNSLKDLGLSVKPLKESGFLGKKYDALVEGELFELKLAKSQKALQNRLRKSFEVYDGNITEFPDENIFKRKTKSIIQIDGDIDPTILTRIIFGQLKNWKGKKPKKLIEKLWLISNGKITKMDKNDLKTFESILIKAKELTD